MCGSGGLCPAQAALTWEPCCLLSLWSLWDEGGASATPRRAGPASPEKVWAVPGAKASSAGWGTWLLSTPHQSQPGCPAGLPVLSEGAVSLTRGPPGPSGPHQWVSPALGVLLPLWCHLAQRVPPELHLLAVNWGPLRPEAQGEAVSGNW